MAFAFSGALSEEDLEVAKYGIEKMKGYITECLHIKSVR